MILRTNPEALAYELREQAWCYEHTCGSEVLEKAPTCTPCTLLVAARNLINEHKKRTVAA